MDVNIAERIREAISHKPEEYLWSCPDSVGRKFKRKTVVKLPAGAESVALEILNREFYKGELDEKSLSLGLIALTTEPLFDNNPMSGDWCLQIYRGKYGELYDFHGWP